MRRTPGPLIIASVTGALLVGVTGCTTPKNPAQYNAMLDVEKVPGVLVAPYEYYFQVDPSASEQDIVTTALQVREILDGLGADRPKEIKIIAVYPGDEYVETEFTTRVYQDPERFERDVRIWAGLLHGGFTEVRYNVFKESGDGVLNVHSGEPGVPGPDLTESFGAMVSALGDDPSWFRELQIEAVVDNQAVSNRTGDPGLPREWGDALARIATLDYVSSSSATLEKDSRLLKLSGTTAPTPEQTSEILAILAEGELLTPETRVTFGIAGKVVATLFGAVK